MQTGTIKGGRALNIVPEECAFDFEVRALPGFEAQTVADQLQAYAEAELLPRMRTVNAASAIHLEPLSAYPGLATPADGEAARLVALLSGSEEFGTVAFGTEGGLFDKAGIPTVVCGPGSMEQGHKPDEFVSVEQLQGCDAMLLRLVDYLKQD
ncbi:Acetylornithine deacetylase [compost metagenome]